MKSRRARIIALLIVVLIVVIGGLMFISAQIQPIFKDIVGVTCIYQVRVEVFMDSNGNGIQDTDETGIAGVTVTLQHSQPFRQPTPEVTMTSTTGAAYMGADSYCNTDDMLTVNVTPPAGYMATTPLSFGPYPVPELTNDAREQAAANPIPATLYVGLKQS